jgi:hypothetical protein
MVDDSKSFENENTHGVDASVMCAHADKIPIPMIKVTIIQL